MVCELKIKRLFLQPFLKKSIMTFKEYIPFYKRNLKVAIPVVITQAGQVAVNLADNIMVGHLGAAELAGVSFANAVFMIGMVFCLGFTQGVTPIVGQHFGKNEKQQCANIFQNSIFIHLLLSIIITAVMVGIGECLGMMGQSPEVLVQAEKYYFINVYSLVPLILFLSIRFFSEGLGNTKNAMWVTLGANLLNIILNWILIFGKFGSPAYGVAGAVWATFISRIVGFVTFLIILLTKKPYIEYIRLFRKPLLNRKSLKTIFKTSIPISLQTLLEVTAFSLAAIMVGWMGKYPLASHQVAQTLSHLTFTIATGIGAAATIRVSHQYGQGNYLETRMAGIASIHMSIAIMGTFGILFILFNRWIPYIFTDDPTVVALASKVIIVMALYQVFDALQMAAVSSLRGLKDINYPLLFSFISYYLIFLPCGYLFGFTFGFGVIGVWVGLLFGLLIAGVLYYSRFDKLTKRIIANNGSTNNQ